MHTSIWWYLRVFPVFHRPEVVDIGVNTIYTIQYNTNRFIFHSGHNMTYEEIYKEYSGR